MGAQDREALARDTRSTASLQTTFGTRPTVAATDSFIVKSYRITPSEVRTDRRNPQPSRDLRERYKGNREYQVSVVCEILPRGGATPPDITALLTNAIGQETVGGSTVTYSQITGQAPGLTWLEFIVGGNTSTTSEFAEIVDGFACEQWKISFDNSPDNIPLIEFTGPAQKSWTTGRFTATGTNGSGTVTAATAAHVRRLAVNSVVGVGTSTNTGAGHRVTSIDYTAGTFVVTPVISGAQTSVDVFPITLWAEASTGGSPTPHVEVTVDFGSDTNAKVTAMEIMGHNNIRERRTVGTQYARDFTSGWRRVDGTISFEATRTDLQKLQDAQWLNVAGVNVSDLVITFGAAGQFGSILTLANCEMDFAALELPDDGTVGTFTLPFVAKADSASSEDACSWVWRTLP